MAHLIDKDALVAEIERRRSKNARNKFNLAAAFEDNYLLSFIDTLEVKDVDLIKEVANWKIDHQVYGMDETFYDFAEHFFKLGVKARQN